MFCITFVTSCSIIHLTWVWWHNLFRLVCVCPVGQPVACQAMSALHVKQTLPRTVPVGSVLLKGSRQASHFHQTLLFLSLSLPSVNFSVQISVYCWETGYGWAILQDIFFAPMISCSLDCLQRRIAKKEGLHSMVLAFSIRLLVGVFKVKV